MESLIILRDEINQASQAIDEIQRRDTNARRNWGNKVPSMDEGLKITVSVVWLAWMLDYTEVQDEDEGKDAEARNA
jgi:hypothetical protein